MARGNGERARSGPRGVPALQVPDGPWCASTWPVVDIAGDRRRACGSRRALTSPSDKRKAPVLLDRGLFRVALSERPDQNTRPPTPPSRVITPVSTVALSTCSSRYSVYSSSRYIVRILIPAP